MELRLKKLRDDEERTKRRIESTKRKLQEAERIKEAKR
jgi:chaperonin cofactor prefoldin